MENNLEVTITIKKELFSKLLTWIQEHSSLVVSGLLTIISIGSFIYYYKNGLGLQYNDARSHLDIGRRVVEGLKPGIAQLGSVWLPLPHALMVATIWNDFMWHSGLSGALQSMLSFVATGLLIFLFLKKLNVSLLGQIVGLAVFVLNINILYMQSTAMTELLLLATMTAGVYYLLVWQQEDKLLNLIKSGFWIMLATLIRYDGWFLLLFAAVLIAVITLKKKGYKVTEGILVLFLTLAGFGIALWFLWNLLIFKDPLYFALGPYSAHAQQQQLSAAGNLATKGDIWLSIKMYYYALAFNTGFFTMIVGLVGAFVFYLDKKIGMSTKLIASTLFAPLIFNILSLYLGFSVLFVQGISGNTWFNIRYGIMMAPSIAIFVGYLISRVKNLKFVLIALLLFVTFFSFANKDAVTIDDARVGSSQKNVSQVADWLNAHAKNTPGFVLISAASHDAIIFSSGLPMSKFIHEGTGAYWTSATTNPDRWARWIIMRTGDSNDQTFKLVSKSGGLNKYRLAGHYPFADIYELKSQYVAQLQTKPVLGRQK